MYDCVLIGFDQKIKLTGKYITNCYINILLQFIQGVCIPKYKMFY